MGAASGKVAFVIAGSIALLAVYLASPSLCPKFCSPVYQCDTDETLHSGYFGYECESKPHHSSWSSWWHPEALDITSSRHKHSAGAITKDWNILYHLGGNGPWVEKTIDVIEGGIAVPRNCEVEQVHMMSRHAERYPTKRAGYNQKAVVELMKKSGKTFNGSLAFFNDWELFWPDGSNLDQLTNTGPFAGTLGSFTTGVRLRTRYQHLLSSTTRHITNNPTTFWASGSNRVIQTAQYFALGFFGINYNTSNTAALRIIPEHSSLGGDTLTPGRTCLANKLDREEGRFKGYRLSGKYRSAYLRPIRRRLFEQTGIHFDDQDVYAMQEMCGFETTVRGRSDWCDVFTQDEFLAFEYSRDLMHYYRAGPGQRYAAAMGLLWLNATTNLLLAGPSAGSLFFSFVHDGDLAPMLTALDIFDDKHYLSTTHIPYNRKWRMSQVLPMGGRVIFELLSCRSDSASGRGKFVRININDGITALPDCDTGPGSSCPLPEFAARIRKRGEEVGDFKELCGLGDDVPERITFLHQ